MPKIVNHEERKENIAEAVWRVIRTDGLDGVSVRRVADEAGMSLGSLRHYFASQDELLAFSMSLISKRVRERIRSLPFTGEPRRDIEIALAELLPLDEIRTLEAEVWLAFAGKAASDAGIRAIYQNVHDDLYAGLRGMIDLLVSRKLAKEGMDAELETRRLHALLDGLVVHRAAFPERTGKDEMLRTVSYHLDSLLGHAPTEKNRPGTNSFPDG
ncbi:TetR/AcrR family transcriptional regulator [Cohnella thermotolerans]|uniref:TetR/AcrR family transcriptional regulator n=1 Tax=Cohnella thermotolerans TaxID=329858 RepID=UPI0003FF4C4E|nr:TetR family transcriptional regulator C-terminal domain-containing protein [Cohnella thermotolerans]